MPKRKYERGNAATLTVPQVAEELGISRYMVRLMTDSGRLRSIRPGKEIMIPRSAVDELLRNGMPNS